MNSSIPGDAPTIPGATPPLNGVPFPMGGTPMPQTALLDFFFPGFSVFSGMVYKYVHIDLNLYIPLLLFGTGLVYVWSTVSEYVWALVKTHLMSIVDVKTDDEIYNMIMHWVADQRFARNSRRFVANTNLNSRNWYVWRWHDDEDEEGEEDESGSHGSRGKKKALAYTPTFGSHWFWYKGRLLIFRRHLKNEQSFLTASEREEISISCFGRNPWILKELLLEARARYMKRDESKTLIYRGTNRGDGGEPSWQRCMARTTRPFSTVILNEKVKQDLIDDVTDYLDPSTRRWYSNRGIPYRRGYLLHGPPGTGKSSLSLALAGFFKMRIYIVSLSSVVSNEENLSSLFAELPRKCVVLLEDIDTAGLTHTREEDKATPDGTAPPAAVGGEVVKVASRSKLPAPTSGRLSLSGLLNILDGVASQEGRVLIMTTNHLEKLDKALIRPGRVDMVVKFDRADKGMTVAIFKAIYAPLEGDDIPRKALATEDEQEKEKGASSSEGSEADADKVALLTEEQEKEAAEKEVARKAEVVKRVGELAERFAEFIPDREFSPAEIQGFLLKNKRNPEAAVEGAAAWVVEAKVERKEKEARDAEEKKRKEEEERKKAEEEKKDSDSDSNEDEEDEKKKKEKRKERSKKKASKKSKKSKKKGGKDSDSSESSDESESESESEAEKKKSAKRSKKRKTAEQKAPLVVETKVVETTVAATAEDQTVAAAEVEGDQEKAIEKTLLVADHKHSGSDSGYGSPLSADFEAA